MRRAQTKIIRYVATLLLSGCLAWGTVHAESEPLWEVGGGATVLSFPDYRGSDQNNVYLFPIPYLIYRGERLKADRHGVRGTLFDTDRIELNLSLNASIPVASSDNLARQSMPDLKGTLEIGPSLDFHLWHSADHNTRFDLRLPLRSAITISSRSENIGQIFLPELNLDIDNVAGNGWNLGMLVGPIYASSDYYSYYYGVNPQYATPLRPAYQTRRGYGGMSYLVAMSKRFPRFWVGSFLRYDNLKGAVFADSPLVKQRGYLAGGIAIAWIFDVSTRMVDVDE